MYTEVLWPVTNNSVYSFRGANIVLLQSFYFPPILHILASTSLFWVAVLRDAIVIFIWISTIMLLNPFLVVLKWKDP